MNSLLSEKNTFFQKIAQLMSGEFDLSLAVKKIEGQLSVIVVPRVNISKTKSATKAINIKPLTLTGTPAELDDGFFDTLEQTVPETQGLVSNVAAYKKSLEKSANNLKKKTSATPVQKPACEPSPEELEKQRKEKERQQRLNGSKNDDHLHELLEKSENDETFAASIKTASIETLKAAWNNSCGGKLKAIEAELKDLTGKAIKELGLDNQTSLFSA